jgi:hypothetical protein
LSNIYVYITLFFIRRLTGWRGSGERLAAVSTWIQGNWLQNKTVAPEAEFLDEIQTKVFRVFLLVIHSHLYNFALYFFKLTQSLTVSRVPLLVQCKGEKRKT